MYVLDSIEWGCRNIPSSSSNGGNRPKRLESISGIQLVGVSLGYEGQPELVSNLNAHFDAAKVHAIIGPSGCGKTTLLNITAGFIRPTSGTITLNNKEIDGPGVERGMVFQQGALFEWLTVAENVNFGLRMKKKDPIETQKKVDEWLEIVGLKGFGNTPTYQLSGGMQQRVALARCLINDPDLILMDEPLGALDALTREKMQSLVLKIWKEKGKTIILNLCGRGDKDLFTAAKAIGFDADE